MLGWPSYSETVLIIGKVPIQLHTVINIMGILLYVYFYFPEKLGRLWEFIRDLLLNPASCPSLICWDNYEEGMFRFVHSDKVAKLWGAKRDNPDMNYEKLSRAMRYVYINIFF